MTTTDHTAPHEVLPRPRRKALTTALIAALTGALGVAYGPDTCFWPCLTLAVIAGAAFVHYLTPHL